MLITVSEFSPSCSTVMTAASNKATGWLAEKLQIHLLVGMGKMTQPERDHCAKEKLLLEPS